MGMGIEAVRELDPAREEGGMSNGSSERGFTKVRARTLQYSEILQELVEFIVMQRAVGNDVSEAVEALSDLCLPLADKVFVKEWEERPVGAFYDEEDARWIPSPVAADVREAFRILMALMGRRGVLVRTNSVSWARGREGDSA